MVTTSAFIDVPFARHGQVIGRVGALAVALGIGLAIAQSPAVAGADDDTATSDSATSERQPAQQDSKDDADSSPDAGDSDEADIDDEPAEDDLPADDPSAEDETTAGDSGSRATVEVVSPGADVDGDDRDDTGDDTADDPIEPAPAAVFALAGSARRESTAETAETTESTALAQTSASPLATEQQAEAEKLAAATVRTWPVRLMKLVLGIGWLATAQREYGEIGGVDGQNFWHLGRSVDEYALGAAFQQQLLNPMTPTVVTQVAPPHTWFGRDVKGSRILYDNPDTVYRFMGVNMTSSYVITGKFSGALPADTNFSVLTGLSGITADNLSGRRLIVEPDGSFTITVSAEAATPGHGNHLQLTPETTLIAVRNTLSDWTTQSPMSLSIERVSGPGNSLFSQLGGFAIPGLGPMVTKSRLLTALVSLIPPVKEPPLLLRGTFTALVMAMGLGRESTYIRVATTDPQTGDRVPPNTLPQPSRNAEFLATQLQSAGYFALSDDEALVVTITPGNARYFVVPVTNQWTISDNYWDEQTSLNNAQAKVDPEGSVTVVISPTDPGVYNWVSTGGLNRGTLSIRFQDLDLASSLAPTVTTRVVALGDLAATLPTTTDYVTAEEREAQLALRRAGFSRRFTP